VAAAFWPKKAIYGHRGRIRPRMATLSMAAAVPRMVPAALFEFHRLPNVSHTHLQPVIADECQREHDSTVRARVSDTASPRCRLLHDLDLSKGTPARMVEVVRSDARRIMVGNADKIWYQFLAIVDTALTYTVKYPHVNSLMWNPATKTPASFQVELKSLDTGSTVRITLAKMPRGSWRYYVWDCINKKAVYWGSNSTALPLQMTASGPPSGVYPNQKNGEARIKICSSLPCSC
jgi:hypothetical protein